MEIEAIRGHCLQLPHTSENVQWGCDLCLKVDGKLFAVMPLEPAPVRLSFKCSPETFAELCERPGIRPAPYMARAQWVALEQLDTLPDSELRDLLTASYRLVFERLPKKRQEELRNAKSRKRPIGRKPVSARKKAQSAGKAKRAGAGK
ncbi:MAG TPA: MmcQ/YjbR family DNA-binding protein [Bryocella sp.]|nr:MmcQ/YjbR family DNA-binding protein [Bryocella sp.]